MSHPLCYPAHMKNKLYVQKHTIASATPILRALQTGAVSLTPCFSKVCQHPPDLNGFNRFQWYRPIPNIFAIDILAIRSSSQNRVALSCTQLHPVAPKHFYSSLTITLNHC
jgi:hypothetical protein